MIMSLLLFWKIAFGIICSFHLIQNESSSSLLLFAQAKTRSHCYLGEKEFVTLVLSQDGKSYVLPSSAGQEEDEEEEEDDDDNNNNTNTTTLESGGPRSRRRRLSSPHWMFTSNNNDKDMSLTTTRLREAAGIEFDLSDANEAFTIGGELTASSSRHRRLQFSPDALPPMVQARKCSCSMHDFEVNYYCESDKAYCIMRRGSTWSERPPPICANETQRSFFVKTVWPVVVVWFSLLLFCLFFTVPGRNALDCVAVLICPCWNRMVVVPMILWRNPDRARLMIRRYRDRVQARYREILAAAGTTAAAAAVAADHAGATTTTTQKPNELVLRTTIFSRQEHHPEHPAKLSLSKSMNDGDDSPDAADPSERSGSPSHVDEEGDETVDFTAAAAATDCTICFAPIEDGDRVGVLPCQKHIFHAACLKIWLKRRNVCPLCMHPQVATPRYNSHSNTSNSNNNESSTAAAAGAATTIAGSADNEPTGSDAAVVRDDTASTTAPATAISDTRGADENNCQNDNNDNNNNNNNNNNTGGDEDDDHNSQQESDAQQQEQEP